MCQLLVIILVLGFIPFLYRGQGYQTIQIFEQHFALIHGQKFKESW
jgi:hypothetical protein